MPPKPKEVLSKLLKIGFEIKRTTDSHYILRHSDGRQTYVSMHTKDIPKGTLNAILRQAQLTKDEFDKI